MSGFIYGPSGQILGGTPGAFRPGTLGPPQSSFPRLPVQPSLQQARRPLLASGSPAETAITLFPPITVFVGILSGIFGGVTQRPLTDVQSAIGRQFPNPDSLVCGLPIDVSIVNSGQPATLNIPCDDPSFGGSFRAKDLDNLIVFLGLGQFFNIMSKFITSQFKEQKPTTSGEDEQINIANVVNVTDESAANAVQSVADAVRNGIGAAADAANNVANRTVGQITDTVNAFSNSLFGWAGDVAKWIGQHLWDIVKGIGSTLKDVFDQIVNAVKDAIVPIAKFVTDTLVPILQSIEKIVANILTFYREHIEPILNAVNESIRAIQGAVEAIRADIKSGIEGFLKLPADLANSFSQLDNAMQRATEALSAKQEKVNSRILFGSENIPTGGLLKGLKDAIAGVVQGTAVTTTFTDVVAIGEHCDPVTIQAAANELGNKIQNATGITKVILDAAIDFVLGLAQIGGVLEKIGEVQLEHANEICPIKKLDPASTAEAVRRGFLTLESGEKEVAKQGLDADRFRVIRDLGKHLEDANTLTEYWFRRIISDSDLASGFRDLGFTDAQKTAALSAAVKLIDPEAAAQGVRRGLLDTETYDEVLRVQRFDDGQRELFKALLFRPPGVDEAQLGEYRRQFAGQFTGGGFDLDTIPSWYQDAGRAEGMNDDTIRQRWWMSWNTLDVNAWVNLYFRGLRTYNELEAKLDELHVPRPLHKDLIDSLRPVIPFRTIPAMVKAEILTRAEGLAALRAHGYSEFDATKLLDYATIGKKTTKADTAAALHAESLATAKTLYEDGSITVDQYREVLKNHGMDSATIDATIQVQSAAAALRNRKAAAQGIVDEFGAGLISRDDAMQQIAMLGFTVAEQAKYLKSLKAAKVANAKVPGEAELRQMMAHDIISPGDYVAALEAQGYSQPWAEAFLALRTTPTGPPTTQAPGGTTP